jgi:hypothetical protein
MENSHIRRMHHDTQKEDETKYIHIKETSFIGIVVRSILKNI